MVGVDPDERRGRRAERRDLGQRDVHEHDLPGDDVDAQIGVNPRQDETHQERRPHQRDEVGGHQWLVALGLSGAPGRAR